MNYYMKLMQVKYDQKYNGPKREKKNTVFFLIWKNHDKETT